MLFLNKAWNLTSMVARQFWSTKACLKVCGIVGEVVRKAFFLKIPAFDLVSMG